MVTVATCEECRTAKPRTVDSHTLYYGCNRNWAHSRSLRGSIGGDDWWLLPPVLGWPIALVIFTVWGTFKGVAWATKPAAARRIEREQRIAELEHETEVGD